MKYTLIASLILIAIAPGGFCQSSSSGLKSDTTVYCLDSRQLTLLTLAVEDLRSKDVLLQESGKLVTLCEKVVKEQQDVITGQEAQIYWLLTATQAADSAMKVQDELIYNMHKQLQLSKKQQRLTIGIGAALVGILILK